MREERERESGQREPVGDLNENVVRRNEALPDQFRSELKTGGKRFPAENV